MSEPVIVCSHVWKYYGRLHHLHVGLKTSLMNLLRPSHRRRVRGDRALALRDVSFEADRGESVGVIGANGAGKSTVLGLIAGVLRPTSGEVIVRPRPYPMLELGAGFHPEFSGAGNVILNGVLLGESRAGMRAKLDEILEFAELRDHAAEPIRTYSTGMVARLGFSIVAHMSPELLLIDEVLAVGDLAFQSKCLDKIASFRRRGVTIVLVSHSLDDIVGVCDRAIWLRAGAVALDAPAPETVKAYREAAQTGDPGDPGDPGDGGEERP